MKNLNEIIYDADAVKIMKQILICIDEFEEIKKEVCRHCNELIERGYEPAGLKNFLNFSVDAKTLIY